MKKLLFAVMTCCFFLTSCQTEMVLPIEGENLITESQNLRGQDSDLTEEYKLLVEYLDKGDFPTTQSGPITNPMCQTENVTVEMDQYGLWWANFSDGTSILFWGGPLQAQGYCVLLNLLH